MANLFEQMREKNERLKKQREDKYLKTHDYYTAVLRSVSLGEHEFDGELVSQIELVYTPLINSDKDGSFIVNDKTVEFAPFDKTAFYAMNEDSLKKVISLLDGVERFSYDDIDNIVDKQSLEEYLSELNDVIVLNSLAITNKLETEFLEFATENGLIFDSVVCYKTETIKGKLRDDKFSFKQLSKHLKANTKVEVNQNDLFKKFQKK